MPSLVLMQDKWNDFGFQTQYQLYRSDAQGSTLVGNVKILKRGQTAADTLQLQTDFDTLPKEFVSVGESLDYYARLTELGTDARQEILDSLRDVAMHPEYEGEFSSESGWETSLFRGHVGEGTRDYLQLARALVTTDYTALPDEQAKFSFHVAGWTSPVAFDFSPPNPTHAYWPPFSLDPLARTFVIIGRNGSGKSTLLFRLARVAFGSATSRSDGVFTELGTLEPAGLGFPRIIAVSYSAFDSFALPGLPPREKDQPDERRQIVNDTRRGEGRFIFVGLRDIAAELEEQIKAEPGPVSHPRPKDDRVLRTRLKPIDALATEFSRTIEKIVIAKRQAVFVEALDRLARDASFSQWQDGETLFSLLCLGARDVFLTWSTGQKIAMQILASLAAHLVPRSLVLFDEPEMHLHPPLIAAMMHGVRHLLSVYKGCAVVATHSPVVLQESLAKHSYLVRREGSHTDVLPPSIETFGENVGSLTSEVFSLHSENTDFYSVLDMFVANVRTLDGIEGYFQPFGLSLQARAYVMRRLAKG